MNKYLIILLLSFFFLFSCRTRQYIVNDYEINNISVDSFNSKPAEYKLQPYDYLYIKISSTNEEINTLYNNISSQYNSSNSLDNASFFLTGYLISDSGFIFVPTIGNLYVQGLTINETRKLIQSEVDKILTDAIVNVRLTNFNVTFLGEFNKKGKMSFYKEKVNLLEAIGTAGDMTSYADKKHLKVIRPINDKFIVYEIDLTNKRLLESKDFFVYPNDVIYAPPRKGKIINENTRDYSIILSTITATITTTILIIQTIHK